MIKIPCQKATSRPRYNADVARVTWSYVGVGELGLVQCVTLDFDGGYWCVAQCAGETALEDLALSYKLGRAGKKSPRLARPHCHQKCLPTGHIFALGCLSRLAEMSKNAAKYRIDSVACLCT